MSGELGACRRAAFSVLVVLFIVHSPGVEGFDQSAYTLNVLCGCRSEPARLNVYAKGYCNNAGVELKSLYSEDFQCEQCKIGSTWTTRREWVEYNPSRAKRDEMRMACLKDLVWENEPYDGTEIAARRVCSGSVSSQVVARVSTVEQRDRGTINLKTWSEQSDIGCNSKFKDLGLRRRFAG